MADTPRGLIALTAQEPETGLLGQLGREPAVSGQLAPTQEMLFQRWFSGLPWAQEFRQRYGEEPSPNAREYDYRKAFQAGITPERYEYDDGTYHWPSKTQGGQWLKSKDHPTAWAETFMEATGVDPFSIGIEDPQSAKWVLQGLKRSE